MKKIFVRNLLPFQLLAAYYAGSLIEHLNSAFGDLSPILTSLLSGQTGLASYCKKIVTLFFGESDGYFLMLRKTYRRNQFK